MFFVTCRPMWACIRLVPGQGNASKLGSPVGDLGPLGVRGFLK